MKKKINQDFIDLTDLTNVAIDNKKKILLFFVINILAIILYSKHLTKDFYFKSNISFQFDREIIENLNQIDLSVEKIIDNTYKYLIDYQSQSNNELNFEIEFKNNIQIDLLVNNFEKKNNEEFFISIKNYLNKEYTDLLKLYIEKYKAEINEKFKIDLLAVEQKHIILKKNLEYNIHNLNQNYEIAKKLNIKNFDINLDYKLIDQNIFLYGYEIIDAKIKILKNQLEDTKIKDIEILEINQKHEIDLINVNNLFKQYNDPFLITSTPLTHEKIFRSKFRNIFYIFPIFTTFLFIIFLLILNIFKKLENSKK